VQYTLQTSKRLTFFWHTCKPYPVIKVSTECLVISWSWVLDNESCKKYFIRHFVLRVLSANFETSWSEVRRKWTWRNQSLLVSYLSNLPRLQFFHSVRKTFVYSVFIVWKNCVNLLPVPLFFLEDSLCCQSVGSNCTFCDVCCTLIAVWSRVAFLRFNILSVYSVLYWPCKDWR
jgi:hypothetical protein